MIISRAFYREAVQTLLAILIVLTFIFLLFGLSWLLGRAVRGKIADEIVLALLGWQTIKRLDLLLPLAFYLGVLLTFSRWYRDSEMVVLAACGIGLPQLLRPVLILALATATVVAWLALVVTPQASRAIADATASAGVRLGIGGLVPGAFTISEGDKRVIYVRDLEASSGNVLDPFILRRKDTSEDVIVATSGYEDTNPDTGEKFLVLLNGKAYSGTTGQADFSIVDFGKYHIRLNEPPAAQGAKLRSFEMTTSELRRSPSPGAFAEWHGRLAKPVSVLVVALFAVALAYTDARRGRMANLFAAVLVYLTYSNLLNLGQSLIKKGKIGDVIGLWWVHALFLAVACYLLWRRSTNRPLLALQRRVSRR